MEPLRGNRGTKETVFLPKGQIRQSEGRSRLHAGYSHAVIPAAPGGLSFQHVGFGSSQCDESRCFSAPSYLFSAALDPLAVAAGAALQVRSRLLPGRLLLLWSAGPTAHGLRSCGSQTLEPGSAVVAQAQGGLLGSGIEPVSHHGQADSQPRSHRGAPFFLQVFTFLQKRASCL